MNALPSRSNPVDSTTWRLPVGALTTIVAAALALAATPRTAAGQFSKLTVNVDLANDFSTGVLPFDEPFVLTGQAAKELRRIVAVWDRADHLSRDSCRVNAKKVALSPRPAPVAKELVSEARQNRDAVHTQLDAKNLDAARIERLRKDLADAESKLTWTQTSRRGSSEWLRPDTLAATFSFSIGPIDPNVEYTLCLSVARSLTPGDVKSFHDDISDGLLAKAPVLAGLTIRDRDALEGLQIELSRVVPKRDSLIFQQNSFLAPRDFTTEAGPVRFSRDSTFLSRLTPLVQAAADPRDGLASLKGSATDLAQALESVASQGILDSLIWIARDAAPVAADTARFIAGGELAVRLHHREGGSGERIAMGSASLDVLDPTLADVPFDKADSLQLLAKLTNLSRTASLLSDLRDLSVAAAESPRIARQVRLYTPQFRTLTDALSECLTQVNLHRLNVQTYASGQANLRKYVAKLAGEVSAVDLATVSTVGSSATTYEDNAKRYVSVDLGVMYAFGGTLGFKKFTGGAASPYLGLNFYLRPVNKHAALALCDGLCLTRRFALMLGITTNSIQRANVRDDLFSNQNAMLGFGLRLTDYFRAGAGGLVFKSFNPANGGQRVTVTPYGSLSIDWDARATLGPVLSKIFGSIS